MKNVLLAGVAVGALLATNVLGAESKPLRPVAAPLPAFSWTGCYVGGNVGWGWGKSDFTQQNIVSSTLDPTSVSRATTGIDSNGAVFGGQLGCDYQFYNQWVIGIQGMMDGAHINGTAHDALSSSSYGSVGIETNWLGSVTGRLGYAFNPQMMLYLKGGAAWARYEVDTSHLATGVVPSGPLKFTLNGWTVGGGFTWAFMPGWEGFVEFNHYDFRDKNLFNGTSTSSGPVPVTTTTSLDLKSNIEVVTIGVNYRFRPVP